MARKEFTTFIYSWFTDDDEKQHAFALDSNNQTVHLEIRGNMPYVYVELPDDVVWSEARLQSVIHVFQNLPPARRDDREISVRPVLMSVIPKKKLYNANVRRTEQGTYEHITYPFIFAAFSSRESLREFCRKVPYGLYVPALSKKYKFKVHEDKASDMLQLTTCRRIPVTGWITGKGRERIGSDKHSSCHREFVVEWDQLDACTDPATLRTVPAPRVMMFDCEANSSNINTMPKNRPDDKIFQISLAVTVQGSGKVDKYLLSLGEPDQKIVGEDVNVYSYKTEGDLLCGFAETIEELDPQIIGGYNILGWDFMYLIQRGKLLGVFNELSSFGYLPVAAKRREIQWSSTAFSKQLFVFLDAPGRLLIDMLPIIKRDFKFPTYRLDYVAGEIIKQRKDPLSVKGIFKCYRIFSPASLGLVGTYCVKDSLITLQLFEKLKTWVSSCQMSATWRVTILDLYTQGQQLKIYSQVYWDCLEKNFVVQNDGYVCAENESYTGAIVLEPEAGIHDDVVIVDFASLYPSVMISHNICYSTLVLDPKIPDEDCHVFEWEDHVGCSHDTVKHKTKVKKVLCCKRYYRFLKEPKGVIPTLLINLLAERKKANNELKKLKAELENKEMDPARRKEVELAASILDGLQGALKTSSNSVRADTPIPCRMKGVFKYLKIEELSDGKWKLEENGQEFSRPIEGLEVWSDQGFTTVPFVMRHRQEKPLTRVSTHRGVVDCTQDHSLLSEEGKEVRPVDLQVGDKLLHYPLPLPEDTPEKALYDNMLDQTILSHELTSREEKEAFVWGYFFADGTCGQYGNLMKAKASWIIYSNNFEHLELLRGYLQEVETCQEFEVSSFYANAGVGIYHLRPKKKVIPIVKKFRTLFYDSRGYKIVPSQILNAPYAVRLAFFLGKHLGDGRHHLEKGIVFSNRGYIGTAALVFLAQSIGYQTGVTNTLDDLFSVQCIVRYFRTKNPTAIKSIEEEHPLRPLKVLKPDLVRNEEKIVLQDGKSSYRNIEISCVRVPRQKLLDALDEAILRADERNADIISYSTSGKDLIYKKRCCGETNNISLRALKEKRPERYSCKCRGWSPSDYHDKVAYQVEPEVMYVYDIETANHHFAAGIGEMIVHNSMYGGFGVRKGKLPFMPGAMCTTAGGRSELIKAKEKIEKNHPCKIIYGDTDSLFIQFEEAKKFMTEGKMDYAQLSAFALEVAAQVSKALPPPMKLEWEVTAKKMLILTKKRYICELTNDKTKIRGIMVARRDNAPACRDIFSKLLTRVLARESQEQITTFLVDSLNVLCGYGYSTKEYVITKSIKDVEDYKVKPPDDDLVKRKKQFLNKNLDSEHHTTRDYLIRSLPAQVQLAERMRKRGMLVEAGSRLEFVMTTMGGIKAKVWQKIEDISYYRDHSDVIRLDMAYYAKSLVNSVDQVLEVVFKLKKFMRVQLEYRTQKRVFLNELIKVTRREVVLL